MKKIKTLFTIGNLDVGGAEKLVINQVKNLDKKKFEPHLCTLFPYGKNNYSEVFQDLTGVPHHRFSFRGPWDIFSWFRVYFFLRREKFDVLCCHLFESNFIIRLINILVGIKPVFIFEHNVYWKKQWWKVIADRWLAKKTSKIFVDSHAILNFTSEQEKINKDKFDILPYPIELSSHNEFDRVKTKIDLGLPIDSFVVGSVGRFVEQKGQSYLIEAAKKVLAKINRQDVYFLLVGYGKMESNLKKLVNELKISDRLLIRSTMDIKEVLPITDIFVVSSLWEGQPIAMLEAMAAGVPVVATAVGGIPEILKDGENGFLAEPKNPTSLAKNIIQMVDSKELRDRLGKEAKEAVDDYSLPVYIEKLEEFFIQEYEAKKR